MSTIDHVAAITRNLLACEQINEDLRRPMMSPRKYSDNDRKAFAELRAVLDRAADHALMCADLNRVEDVREIYRAINGISPDMRAPGELLAGSGGAYLRNIRVAALAVGILRR